MDRILIGFAVLWSVQMLVFSTILAAIRISSHTRLTDALKRIRPMESIEEFDRHEREYALTAMLFQQSAFALFVVTIGLLTASDGYWYFDSLKVLAISVVWFLLVGVSLPAAVSRYLGERCVVRFLPVLRFHRRLSRPILTVINAIDEIVRRLAGAPTEEEGRDEEMEREILDAVSQAETTGAVDRAETHMIKSALDLDEMSAAEIMTPRTDMVGIETGAGYQEARELVRMEGHSRIPVYEETLDNIVGVLYAKDLLCMDDPATFSLTETMREATFVPETKDLAALLSEFQANRVHMAIVLDEYGGTEGLVTIEDILEELVGEITDEHEEPSRPPISPIDADTAEFDARVRVEEVNDELNIQLPEDEGYDTIGGYVFSKLGRIPAAGESFDNENVHFDILEAEERSIGRLRIHVVGPLTGK